MSKEGRFGVIIDLGYDGIIFEVTDTYQEALDYINTHPDEDCTGIVLILKDAGVL